MISAVAEMYHIHPQTLRLYERENLLVPSRSEGNTRLYTQDDLERLEIILKLTRELAFMEYVRSRVEERPEELDEHFRNALVRVAPPRLIRLRAPHRE